MEAHQMVFCEGERRSQRKLAVTSTSHAHLPPPLLDVGHNLVITASGLEHGHERLKLRLLRLLRQTVIPLDTNLHRLLAFVHDNSSLGLSSVDPCL